MRAWRWSNVPVPEQHLGGLALGILLQVFLSWRVLPEAWMGHAIGWPLVLAGCWLAAWAVIAAADVDVEHPNHLIVNGPYVFSRNPMYVAWTLIYVGVAFVVNGAWPIALLPPVLLLVHVAVLREERGLKGQFGAEYRYYASRVRRYL
jgi:protein-S-isoprenylcysteine O-methyltransferase Ste14